MTAKIHAFEGSRSVIFTADVAPIDTFRLAVVRELITELWCNASV